MKRLLFTLLMAGTFMVAKSQDFHLALFAGTANYQGDLQSKRFTLQQSHFAGGIGGLYELSEKFYIRAFATYGTVSATDKKDINKDRNLSFSSVVGELHLGLEYDLLNLYERSLTPYIFAGVGGYYFNPSAIDKNGDKVYLQPLGTEGQGFYNGRKKYSLVQMSLPFGGGLKFALTQDVRIRLEVGLRKLFTDYMDDVSTTYPNPAALLANNGAEAVALSFRGGEIKPTATFVEGAKRGNPASKDWYYFSGISISFRLMPGNDRSRSGKGNTGCPKMVY